MRAKIGLVALRDVPLPDSDGSEGTRRERVETMAELFDEEAARSAGRLSAVAHINHVTAYGGTLHIEPEGVDVPGMYAAHADAFRDAFMVTLGDIGE